MRSKSVKRAEKGDFWPGHHHRHHDYRDPYVQVRLRSAFDHSNIRFALDSKTEKNRGYAGQEIDERSLGMLKGHHRGNQADLSSDRIRKGLFGGWAQILIPELSGESKNLHRVVDRNQSVRYGAGGKALGRDDNGRRQAEEENHD